MSSYSVLQVPSELGKMNVQKIDEFISSIMTRPDPRYIKPLLLALDDSAADDSGMFSIIHAAESFSDEAYIEAFLSIIQTLTENNPKWASILLMRIINNEKSKSNLFSKLKDADKEAQQSINYLCNKINERNPAFIAKTLSILLASKTAQDFGGI